MTLIETLIHKKPTAGRVVVLRTAKKAVNCLGVLIRDRFKVQTTPLWRLQTNQKRSVMVKNSNVFVAGEKFRSGKTSQVRFFFFFFAKTPKTKKYAIGNL